MLLLRLQRRRRELRVSLLVNTPMNPIGKVFTRDELAAIAALMERHDAYAVCDEVYEHLLFDGITHRPLMTFDGMADRCVRIGSAGKTFSLTGWKVGYITGAQALIDPIAKAHQYVTFTTPPNLQKAVAYGLAKDESYYDGLSAELQAKRDLMAAGLKRLGFGVLPCAATYFLTCDISGLGLGDNDIEVCQKMVEKAVDAEIPVALDFALSETIDRGEPRPSHAAEPSDGVRSTARWAGASSARRSRFFAPRSKGRKRRSIAMWYST